MNNKIQSGLGRRGLLALLPLLPALALAGRATGEPVGTAQARVRLGGRAVRVVDLTHRLTAAFNITPAQPRIALEPIQGSGAAVGMRLNRLALVEHTGTHLDAPSHFSAEQPSLGELPIGDLVLPLAVLDLKARVRADRGAAVTVADVLAWERRHGRLPDDCCLALKAGWDPIAERARARELPAPEARKFPGYGPEVVEFLLAERRVKGLAVESLSIDAGDNVPAYPVHRRWLRSGRWGIEGITNLDAVPAVGAILAVGAPPIQGATGAPVRVFAMI